MAPGIGKALPMIAARCRDDAAHAGLIAPQMIHINQTAAHLEGHG